MDFDLTEEQEDFRRAVREFAEEVVAPRAAEMDEKGELPMDIVKQMGELGLFGLPFPEEYGGQGADFTSFCIAVEELARVDSSIAITLEAAVGLGANPIYANGTEEQKKRWLVPMARGDILGAFGLTEPGGGRIAIASLSVGLAQGCLDESVAYAKERRAFGRRIGEFQALQFKIADMRVAVETSRLATYKAAWLRDMGRPYKAEAALAKL